MALRPTCDVFGTAKGVAMYRVQVEQIDRKTGTATDGVCVYTVDLCPRALERLKTKIVAGTTPPRPRLGSVIDPAYTVIEDEEPKQENES